MMSSSSAFPTRSPVPKSSILASLSASLSLIPSYSMAPIVTLVFEMSTARLVSFRPSSAPSAAILSLSLSSSSFFATAASYPLTSIVSTACLLKLIMLNSGILGFISMSGMRMFLLNESVPSIVKNCEAMSPMLLTWS